MVNTIKTSGSTGESIDKESFNADPLTAELILNQQNPVLQTPDLLDVSKGLKTMHQYQKTDFDGKQTVETSLPLSIKKEKELSYEISGFSIKAFQEQQLDQKRQEQAQMHVLQKPLEGPQNAFNKEQVYSVWEGFYAQHQSGLSVDLKAAFDAFNILSVKGSVLELAFQSTGAKKAFDQVKSTFLGELKKRLANVSIEIVSKIAPVSVAKTAYTPQERLNTYIGENPEILSFIQKLKIQPLN